MGNWFPFFKTEEHQQTQLTPTSFPKILSASNCSHTSMSIPTAPVSSTPVIPPTLPSGDISEVTPGKDVNDGDTNLFEDMSADLFDNDKDKDKDNEINNNDIDGNNNDNDTSTTTTKSRIFQHSSSTSPIPAPTFPTKEATEHLSKELQNVLQLDSAKHGFRIEPVEDNIFKWNIHLFDFDEGSQIQQDLELYKAETGRETVLLEVVFPFHYPQSPPFLRVVYPRFHQYTGHITIGGSVCIKDLTTSGWNSKNELFPFFVMMRNLLLEGFALIDMGNLSDYTEAEAKEAFQRVAQAHGWMP